jgi:hypothetical protein
MSPIVVRAVYAVTLLAPGLIAWLWVRWARSTPSVRPPLFRRLSTLASLLSLSISGIILVTILLFPGSFSGLHGTEPAYAVFMLGVFAAIGGSIVGSWAVQVVRDGLTPTAWVLIALYVIVMGDLEPGSW